MLSLIRSILKSFLPICLTVLAAVAPLRAVNAADIRLEQRDGYDLIHISGEIVEADVALFQRIALGSEDAIVVLDSSGGYLDPALKIGEIIRLKGFGTVVGNNQVCTSSCALIWVAGAKRFLTPTSRIGFHASYTVSNGNASETGLGNALVGRYLTLLNLPEKAIAFATSASPDQMSWIDPFRPGPSGIDFELLAGGGEQERRQPSTESRSTRASPKVKEFEWYEGSWSVLSSLRLESCFIAGRAGPSAGDESWTLIVNVEPFSDIARISFSSAQFQSVEDGASYAVSVVFLTGEKADRGWGEREFFGVIHDADGKRGLVTELSWNDLRDDLANEDYLGFVYKGEVAAAFGLGNMRRNLQALDRCLSSANNNSSDPFSR